MAGSLVWARCTVLAAGRFLTVAWLRRRPCPSLVIEIEVRDSRRVVGRRWGSLGQKERELHACFGEEPKVQRRVMEPTCRTAVEGVAVGGVAAGEDDGVAAEGRGTGVSRGQEQGQRRAQEQERWAAAASAVSQ